MYKHALLYCVYWQYRSTVMCMCECVGVLGGWGDFVPLLKSLPFLNSLNHI